jgi:hypothetical protein
LAVLTGHYLRNIKTFFEVDMDWIARLKQAPDTRPDPLEAKNREYHDTLTRYWAPEAEDLPAEELHRMLAKLDGIFRELTRQGQRLDTITPEGRAYLREA